MDSLWLYSSEINALKSYDAFPHPLAKTLPGSIIWQVVHLQLMFDTCRRREHSVPKTKHKNQPFPCGRTRQDLLKRVFWASVPHFFLDMSRFRGPGVEEHHSGVSHRHFNPSTNEDLPHHEDQLLFPAGLFGFKVAVVQDVAAPGGLQQRQELLEDVLVGQVLLP